MSTPSLITRFTRWVHTLPIPARTFYFALLLVGLVLSIFARWIAGVLPGSPLTINGVYDVLTDPATVVGILAIYYYLDEEIAEAVDQSRSVSALPEEQFAKLSYELGVIPLWPHLILGLIFAAGSAQAAMETYGFHAIQASNVLVIASWGLVGALTFGFVYRVIRLMVLAGQFYAGPLHLTIYNLPPIYELATAVGKAALFLLLVWYSNLIFNLDVFANPSSLAIASAISLAPLMAYILPQAILSRRLAREKTSLVGGVLKQLERTFARLRVEIESENLEGIKSLQAGIDSLLAEKHFIETIPTWPWRLGTFRIALTAVLLPVFVWLIQQVLEKVLAF